MADGEPARQTLMTAVKLARQEEPVVTDKTRCESKSKGLVENAHQLVQVLLRTWMTLMKKRHCPSSPLVQRGVRQCGWSLTRHTILEDGLTPCRKLRGREYGGAIAEMGETVLFHVQGLSQKFPRRCEKAIWMGKMSWTDEHILGTPRAQCHEGRNTRDGPRL